MPSVSWTENTVPPTSYVEGSVPAVPDEVILFGPWMPMPIPGPGVWSECETPAVTYTEGSSTPVPWVEGTL
jgi:hypothetical protein